MEPCPSSAISLSKIGIKCAYCPKCIAQHKGQRCACGAVWLCGTCSEADFRGLFSCPRCGTRYCIGGAPIRSLLQHLPSGGHLFWLSGPREGQVRWRGDAERGFAAFGCVRTMRATQLVHVQRVLLDGQRWYREMFGLPTLDLWRMRQANEAVLPLFLST